MGKQVLITAIATLGGFVFGSDVGLVSKIQTYQTFIDFFKLSNAQLGLMVAALLLGCMMGSLGSSYLAESYGRKKSIIIGSIVFTAGIFTQLSAMAGFTILVLGRYFTGLAVGILSSVVPMYLSEVCDPDKRGMLVSCQQLAITIGILVSYLVAMACEGVSVFGLSDWQTAISLQLIPAALMFFGMLTLPASPRWLLSKRLYEEAKKALSNLRGKTFKNVENEYYELKSEAEMEIEQLGWSEAFKQYGNRILIGIFVQMFQQISGINGLMVNITNLVLFY